jgi:prepilin-type N-terminal cleavage/methylation domain-containing protein
MINNKKGFSMIEVVIAIGIAVMFFLAIYEFILFSNKATLSGLRRVEATHLAQEAVEAVRTVRNNTGWDAGISPLISGDTYSLSLSGGSWVITDVPSPLINDVFARTITFYDVMRDPVTSDISETGDIDERTRKIVVTISWNEKGTVYNEYLETYITDFLDN